MRSVVLALSTVGIGLAAGGGVALHEILPTAPVTRGVAVDDHPIPAGEDARAWLVSRGEETSRRRVTLRADGQVFEASFAELGVELDVDATLEAAKRVGHEGSWIHRLAEARRARRGLVDVASVWRFERDTARATIAGLAPSVYRAPSDARVDLTKHERVPDEPGRELDVEGALNRVEDLLHGEHEVVSLPTRSIPANVTLGSLTTVHVEKVVSAFETTFSLFGTGAGRATNIRRATELFEGTVLAPGQSFSFNEKVGPRTRERGFVLAPEIQNDEMQLGYGGGTCQASTTLYGAALFGALEIVERQPHSRPSHYTQMGLDATVSYPLADLKIRNSLPFPVLLHAYFPNPTTVRVEILGGDPVAKVDYVYGVSGTEDFVRRVQVKDTLPPGQHLLHQKGIMGFDVNSVVRLHYFDGREDERRYFSGYRPAPEIYWIAPGYDLARLPPLPEHASGTEPIGG